MAVRGGLSARERLDYQVVDLDNSLLFHDAKIPTNCLNSNGEESLSRH